MRAEPGRSQGIFPYSPRHDQTAMMLQPLGVAYYFEAFSSKQAFGLKSAETRAVLSEVSYSGANCINSGALLLCKLQDL